MKKNALFVLLLSAPLLLASCGSIKAKFLNGEEKLTTATEKSLSIDHDEVFLRASYGVVNVLPE